MPAKDLALLVVEAQDKAAAEYAANLSEITGVRRKYVWSRCSGSGEEYVGSFHCAHSAIEDRIERRHGWLILPRGTADLSFASQPAAIRNWQFTPGDHFARNNDVRNMFVPGAAPTISVKAN